MRTSIYPRLLGTFLGLFEIYLSLLGVYLDRKIVDRDI